ncbi:MAG: hypothetical protein MK066_01665 [Crocinitomicaceae bacterium]|nr:hypothetical protein [Crocinitomicaceae bacterium]
MKKVLFAMSLLMFIGTVGATAYAATSDVKTELNKDDKKKKKKKKKKGEAKKSCSSEKTCCSKKKK